MDKTKRKAIIAGNWKMNKTPSEAKTLLEAVVPAVKDADCEVIACVPFVDLSVALETTKGSNVKIGAENCHWAESGAFTGEISALMLKEMGVEYVVLGHSERRQYFGETKEKLACIDCVTDALTKRIEFFAEMGCRASDHGLDYIPYREATKEEVKFNLSCDNFLCNVALTLPKKFADTYDWL